MRYALLCQGLLNSAFLRRWSVNRKDSTVQRHSCAFVGPFVEESMLSIHHLRKLKVCGLCVCVDLSEAVEVMAKAHLFHRSLKRSMKAN